MGRALSACRLDGRGADTRVCRAGILGGAFPAAGFWRRWGLSLACVETCSRLEARHRHPQARSKTRRPGEPGGGRLRLTVCATYLALALCAAAEAAERPAPLGKLVDVGGYRVHLYCTGSGSPSVMIVGAGFSFDWALVQPAVAKFATVCTYDPAGMAWSDAGPKPTCRGRADEVHSLVRAADLAPPLVLVGLSIGACVARLYAAEHPSEVAGMVIVDHAFSPEPDPDASKSLGANAGLDSPPVLIYQEPIRLTAEDTSDFRRLPERVQALHRWAMSLDPHLPTADMLDDCLDELKAIERGSRPLGDLPLAVVSTGNQARGYARLQSSLLELSRRSTQFRAEHSFHSVEIDQPEVVVEAIRHVVETARRSGH